MSLHMIGDWPWECAGRTMRAVEAPRPGAGPGQVVSLVEESGECVERFTVGDQAGVP